MKGGVNVQLSAFSGWGIMGQREKNFFDSTSRGKTRGVRYCSVTGLEAGYDERSSK